MKEISRREFLRLMGIGIGAVSAPALLTACQPGRGGSHAQSPVASPTTFQPQATSTGTSASSGYPDLVVAHGEDPEKLVYQSLKAFGGIERFLKPGADVIIKPNISVPYYTYEYGATTNPWVVGALVKLCLENGAKKVRVMDSPYGGTAEDCYISSGIQEQVEANGGVMEVMLPLKYQTYDIPGGKTLKSLIAYPDFFSTDLFINLPIAKQHGLSSLSLGLKNLFGTIQKRERMHAEIQTKLVDLGLLVKPHLTIIDATRTIMVNGPAGGNLDDVKVQNMMIVSTDIIAADSYATKLFRKKPEHLPYLVEAAERGLGRIDYENLNLKEITIDA